MSIRDEAIEAARRYLSRNPSEIARALRGLMGLRLGLPLDALRWLAERAGRTGRVWDVEIAPVPPGLRIAATTELMRTRVRASADLYVQRLKVNRDELRVELRLEKVQLDLAQPDATTPVALLIRSGALDLSRPGDVIRRLPNVPAFVVDAHDDIIVLDLLRLPALAGNEVVRHWLEVATSLVTLHGIETDEGHLDVNLRAFPEGLAHAARTVRRLVVGAGFERARERLKLLRAGWS